MYITVANTVSKQEIYFKWFFFFMNLQQFACLTKDIVNGGYVMSEGQRA